VICALAVAACQDSPNPVSPNVQFVNSPLAAAKSADVIPGEYIVVFKNEVIDPSGVAEKLIEKFGAKKRYSYSRALKGFAAQLPDAAVEALRLEPAVAYIEQDQIVNAIAVQSGATWGLDRSDQRDLPLNTTYSYNADGSGVTAYIIDTGIRFDHAEFGGRAVSGFDAVTAGGSAADCNGHGTHVAGTVGGSTYGIAKNVRLVAVRVLDCSGSGTNSGVIAGIDWVTGNHAAGAPAAANMSLGGGASTALDNAVINSIADGVTYGVAAGNSNADACTASPARAGPAITVASTTSTDARSSFSNFGTCVDIFAPGSSITSAWYTSATATNTISGTSMATPHVVGAAALYLQGNTSATPAQVEAALEGNATGGKVTAPGAGSPNLLLYTLFIGGGPPPPPPPPPPANAAPVASYTWSCAGGKGKNCTFDGSSSTDDKGVTAYSWAFGDGTTGSGVSVTHRFASTGQRAVTLTVTDAGSLSGSRTCNVQTGTSGTCAP